MSAGHSKATLDYFLDTYGPDIKEDSMLSEYLSSIASQRFGMGEQIPDETLRENEKIVLISGKIRLLQKNMDGTEYTAFILGAGDIWDSRLLDKGSVTLIVSSKESVICTLPTSLVLENPILQRHWENTLYKISQLKQQSNISSESVVAQSASKSSFQPAKQVTIPASSSIPESPIMSHTLAWLFLTKIFEYYQWPMPIKDNIPEIHNIDDLIRILESQGIRTKKASHTWRQLLNANYPFILLDNGGRFRWITGRQGNTLLSGKGEKAERFIPEDLSSQQSYTALFLKAPVSRKASVMQTPFTIGWYIHLCVQNWFLSLQMVISSLLIQIFALGTPLFYIVIFDRVFGHQNFSTLDIMSIGIILVLVFELLIKLLRSYVLSHQLEFIDKASMETFLDRIFDIPLAKSGFQMTRSFTERFPELVRMNQNLASMFLLTALDVAFSVLLVAVLLMLHTQLALISLASLIPIAIMSFWTTPLTKKRAIEFNKDQRACQLKLTEAMEHSETIHSLNAENILKWKIAERLEDHLHKGFNSRYDRVSGPIGQNFIAGIGGIVTLYFGAHAVLQGEISFGIYMAISMLSRQVIGSIQRLLASILQFQEAMETLEHFKTLYKKDADETIPGQGVVLREISGDIRFIDVRFRYNSEAPWVLKEINLEIEPGQKVIITGRSGAGKTSLLRLLQRLYEPTSGYITLDGFHLTDMDIGNLRNHVSIALQRPAIFAGTIRDNIALGNPSAPMRDIVEAASMAQLDQDLLQLPKGFDTPLAPGGANLSGGQASRVALARIFLMKPSILILDEALASCDPTLNAIIFAHVLEKYSSSTCIFITDYLPVHQRADKIIVLNEGQIVEQGSYSNLIKTKSYYAHLHHPQVTA